VSTTADLTDPVIVVGAGRSGTTMVRRALAAHSDFGTSNLELNELWRYGNASVAHDMLRVEEHGNPKNAAYIRSRLAAISAKTGKRRFVEKTVANVMRLRYVHFVLPNATFIHLIRDGRAATASAVERWKGTPRLDYLMRKSRSVPLRQVLRSGLRFIANRIKARLRRRHYTQSWGPRWPGMDEDVRTLSLPEVCAKQWMIAVRAALEQKGAIPEDRYLEVRYEELVADPVAEFGRLADFVGADPLDAGFQEHVRTQIHASSVDKWKQDLKGDDLERVERIIGPLLEELGYTTKRGRNEFVSRK